MNAMEVAKQLLYTGHSNNIEITNLKLQKLLHFANLTYISIKGEPLFPEKVKAWELGPVVGSVYHHYKSFENGIICAECTDHSENTSDSILKSICDFVIEVFGVQPTSKLVDMTHRDPVYETSFRKEDKTMCYTQKEAKEAISQAITNILQRAAYASLREKLNPSDNSDYPEYVDDYEGVSEEERLKIWGIKD